MSAHVYCSACVGGICGGRGNPPLKKKFDPDRRYGVLPARSEPPLLGTPPHLPDRPSPTAGSSPRPQVPRSSPCVAVVYTSTASNVRRDAQPARHPPGGLPHWRRLPDADHDRSARPWSDRGGRRQRPVLGRRQPHHRLRARAAAAGRGAAHRDRSGRGRPRVRGGPHFVCDRRGRPAAGRPFPRARLRVRRVVRRRSDHGPRVRDSSCRCYYDALRARLPLTRSSQVRAHRSAARLWRAGRDQLDGLRVRPNGCGQDSHHDWR